MTLTSQPLVSEAGFNLLRQANATAEPAVLQARASWYMTELRFDHSPSTGELCIVVIFIIYHFCNEFEKLCGTVYKNGKL